MLLLSNTLDCQGIPDGGGRARGRIGIDLKVSQSKSYLLKIQNSRLVLTDYDTKLIPMKTKSITDIGSFVNDVTLLDRG
jgi:hypothetical protein